MELAHRSKSGHFRVETELIFDGYDKTDRHLRSFARPIHFRNPSRLFAFDGTADQALDVT
jgi:hypothetical protein